MRRFLPTVTLLSAALLGGCRTPGESRPVSGGGGASSGGGRAVEPPETDPLKPGHWLHTSDGAGRPGVGVPLSSDPELRGEVKSLLAGYVYGPSGQKVKKATIQVEPLNSPGEGAIDYETQSDGSFMIAGLTTGKTYRLTVRHNDDGVRSAGQTLARVPKVYINIHLIEGLDLTPAETGRALSKPPPDPKPADDRNRKPRAKDDPLKNPPGVSLPAFDRDGPLPPPGDASSLPAPRSLLRDTTLTPGGRTDLPADDWSPTRADPPPRPARPPYRPDLNTRRPDDGFRPPLVDLPPLTAPGRQESRRPSADEFYLIDESGKERRFPSGRPGEWLLVEFMTTTCVPCQRALPTLTAIQAKYGPRGLSVIGVTCDDEPLRTRVIYAGKYRTEHAVNFPILTEPGAKPGAVMKRFGVRVYPTTVLLDHTGSVLWQGNPGDTKGLVSALEGRLPPK